MHAGGVNLTTWLKRGTRGVAELSAGINKKTGETNARYSQAALNRFSAYIAISSYSKAPGKSGSPNWNKPLTPPIEWKTC